MRHIRLVLAVLALLILIGIVAALAYLETSDSLSLEQLAVPYAGVPLWKLLAAGASIALLLIAIASVLSAIESLARREDKALLASIAEANSGIAGIRRQIVSLGRTILASVGVMVIIIDRPMTYDIGQVPSLAGEGPDDGYEEIFTLMRDTLRGRGILVRRSQEGDGRTLTLTYLNA